MKWVSNLYVIYMYIIFISLCMATSKSGCLVLCRLGKPPTQYQPYIVEISPGICCGDIHIVKYRFPYIYKYIHIFLHYSNMYFHIMFLYIWGGSYKKGYPNSWMVCWKIPFINGNWGCPHDYGTPHIVIYFTG